MSTDAIITCPYCRAIVPADVTVCPDCQEDLSAILRLKYEYVIYYNQALALAREGKLDKAITKALLALEHKENFTPAHVLLAKAYAQRGEWLRAEASAARATELEPENASLHALVERIRETQSQQATARQQEDEQAAIARRRDAEHTLAVYEQDVRRAFGVGVGATVILVLMISLLGGKKRRG